MKQTYIKLAKQVSSIDGFSVKDLEIAIIFTNKKNYYTDKKVPNVIFCGYTRKDSNETGEYNIHGTDPYYYAQICATTYWIINDEYVICDAMIMYCYGYDAGETSDKKISFEKWLDNDQKYSPPKNIKNMIDNFMSCLLTSGCGIGADDRLNDQYRKITGFKKVLLTILEDVGLENCIDTNSSDSDDFEE